MATLYQLRLDSMEAQSLFHDLASQCEYYSTKDSFSEIAEFLAKLKIALNGVIDSSVDYSEALLEENQTLPANQIRVLTYHLFFSSKQEHRNQKTPCSVYKHKLEQQYTDLFSVTLRVCKHLKSAIQNLMYSVSCILFCHRKQ